MKHHAQRVHMNPRRAALLVGAAAALIGGQALATTDNPAVPCFHTSQWLGWKAPDRNTLYLGVNGHDVYRVDLHVSPPDLMYPNVQLVSGAQGSSAICTALDLQLAVVNASGMRQPIIARSLTKLTPEQVSAIPKKYRPN